MSGALVYFWPGAQSLEGLTPRVDERWASAPGAVRRRVTIATVLVLIVSVVVHVGLVATAFWKDAPSSTRPQQEIAVEVVPEMPKAAGTPADPVKTAEAPPPPAKAAETPPEPKPVERAEAPRPEEAKAQPEPKPSLPPKAGTPPIAPPKAEADLKALRDELASLRAEQAALQAEKSAVAPPPAPAAPSGLGPLAESFQAVALPTHSDLGDLPVGYAAIVFSQLAKAKEIGQEMGQPGTAAVSFDIDDKGALAGVRLVTSSGIAKLDDEAVSIVRKAAPFPPPPPGAQRSFSANVSFVGRAGP